MATFHHGIRRDLKNGFDGLTFASVIGGDDPSLDVECTCLNCFLNPQMPLCPEWATDDISTYDVHTGVIAEVAPHSRRQ